MTSTPPFLRQVDGGVELRIKAVPGSSRDAIAGPLGDRLKIRVSAPPEGGKANKSILNLLANTLGLKSSQIEITAGHASAEKTMRVLDANLETLCQRLSSE